MATFGTGEVPGPNARRYRTKDHIVIIDPDDKRAWVYGASMGEGVEVLPDHRHYNYNETYVFQGAEDMRILANSGDAALDPDRAHWNQRALEHAAQFGSRQFPLMGIVVGDQVLSYQNVHDVTPVTPDPLGVDEVTISWDVEIDGEIVRMDAEQYQQYLADQERHQTYGGVPEA